MGGFLTATAIVGAWLVDRSRARLVQRSDELVLHEFGARMQSFIESRLVVAEHVADSVHAFVSENGGRQPSPDLFQGEATSLVGLYPDIQAINWIDLEGIVRIVVPHAGNRPALGANILTLAEAGPVLSTAIATTTLRVTPPIELMQGGRGIAAYRPVFVGGRLVGTVNLVFRTDPLITSALPIDLFNRYAVRLSDGGTELFAAPDHPTPGADDVAVARNTIMVGNRTWLVELRPTRAFAEVRRSHDSLVFLIAGLTGAVTISLLVFLTMRHAGRLRLSEARFRDYLDTSSDYYWETDADLRYTQISDRFSEVTGLAREAIIGRRHGDSLVPLLDRDGAAWPDAPPFEPFRERVVSLCRPDGSEVWLSISGKPVLDRQGRFFGYRGTGRDITAEVRTLQQSQDLRDQAEQASRSKSAFLAHMSHDLRTPLNSIIGFSTILHQEMFGRLGASQYKQYVEHIRDSGELLLSLVNDVLDLSRIESGEHALDEEWLDVPEIFDAVVNRAAGLTEDGSDRMRIDAPSDAPSLYADPRAITQILDNLVTNGIKHAGDDARITLSWAVDADGSGVLGVADDGHGIPPHLVGRLTEPFVHGGSARSHLSRGPSDGTGLGLSIVDKLVRLQDATLDIVSAAGQGTRVTIRFAPDRVEPAPSD